MSIASNIQSLNNLLKNTQAKLIAVSKTKPNEDLLAAYEAGQRAFGENRCKNSQESQKNYQTILNGT